ncbi:hypothetical protein DUI87_24326 [Hirundo rustica rustica]|uniref:Uncharacterized protein n=1 Tax=Hirundo rustica rustica TaxID=333673 RepID=A0A3M0JW12_HIRRU|nr:hypothetical protein DUI87_24326 [Hirundo rustica rustica]
MRELGDELLKLLSIISHQSWLTGELPEDWRCQCEPIPKKGWKEDLGNSRPVSLTLVPGKDFAFLNVGWMEEEAVRKRKMPQDSQADKELRMETKEDKSPQQNLVEEAVLSGSMAQESNREKKAPEILQEEGLQTHPRVQQGGKTSLCQEGGQSFSQSNSTVQH